MEQCKDYSLLRPFDLEAAKNGALVCWMYEDGPLRYIGKATCGADTACFEWIGGTHKGTFETYPNTNLRMSPLCWVEGRPVYPGDNLYLKNGCGVFTAGGRMVGVELNSLTWSKPKRTVKKAGWINIYPLSWMDGRTGAIYPTKTAADNSARSARIACARVEWEEAIP